MTWLAMCLGVPVAPWDNTSSLWVWGWREGSLQLTQGLCSLGNVFNCSAVHSRGRGTYQWGDKISHLNRLSVMQLVPSRQSWGLVKVLNWAVVCAGGHLSLHVWAAEEERKGWHCEPPGRKGSVSVCLVVFSLTGWVMIFSCSVTLTIKSTRKRKKVW